MAGADHKEVVQCECQRIATGEYDLWGWQTLWGLLGVITVRRCEQSWAYGWATRRGARREVRCRDLGFADPWGMIAELARLRQKLVAARGNESVAAS